MRIDRESSGNYLPNGTRGLPHIAPPRTQRTAPQAAKRARPTEINPALIAQPRIRPLTKRYSITRMA